MTFGTKLRKYREQKRLSQRELADLIGVSQSTYSNWEGDIRNFGVEYLAKLAQLFDVSITELMPEGTRVENDLHNKSVLGAKETEERSELYTDLLRTKDEIIRLLKEENTQLKTQNTQLENK